MIALIRAELRKNWKTKKFLIAILCFICLMACSYFMCLRKGQVYHYEEGRQLADNFRSYSSKTEELKKKLSTYKTEAAEPTGLRKEYETWKEAAEASQNYLYMRQSPEYFGWDKITESMERYSRAINALSAYAYEVSEEERLDFKNDVTLYTYMLEHGIDAYSSPFEPNFMNFIVQMFQNESIILLIIIAAFFIVEQICQDFDYGSYKNIYIVPYKRSAIMSAKIISATIMMAISLVVSFIVFSCVPLMTYGLGSAQYMYIFNHQLVGYFSYMARVVSLLMLILVFYMAFCVILSNIFKNVSNAMLAVAGTLIAVYLCVKFFGLNPIFAWLPLFYLYPMEIAFAMYPYPWYVCVGLCMAALFGMYMLFRYRLEKADLKGSEAS